MWVAEIQWYRGGAKNPPADKIKVLEDTDGDGRADKVTVFAEGLFAPMSICVAGTQGLSSPPAPTCGSIEDKNGDLKADGPPHKAAHRLRRPQPRSRRAQPGAGSRSQVVDVARRRRASTCSGTDGSRVKYRWGAVLRGELDGSKLETVAVNFRNPYEVCVNSFGEAYLSDNDNDGNESVRICWIMEGGNYGWFGGPPFGKQELDGRLSPGHAVSRALALSRLSCRASCRPRWSPASARRPACASTKATPSVRSIKNAPLHTDAGPRECRVYRHEPARLRHDGHERNLS